VVRPLAFQDGAVTAKLLNEKSPAHAEILSQVLRV
jgi:hypothetical protein